MWHEILAGSNFCDFSSDLQKKVPAKIKINATIFPAKIYFRVNLNELQFATQKYSNKKSCMFNYKLPLSFRNKTVYNELLVLHRVPIP